MSKEQKVFLDRWDLIQEYVTDKKVLDLGSVELMGSTKNKAKRERWLFARMKKVAKSLVGLDLNKKQIKLLQKEGFDIREGNAEDFDLKQTFEVIVMGELIEHLSNPGLALDCIRKHLKKNGQLIISTPNRFDVLTFYAAFKTGKIPEYKKDIAKHVMYFDQSSLSDLLIRHKFKIERVAYFQAFSKNYNSGLSAFLSNLVARFRPEFSKGMIIIAKKP